MELLPNQKFLLKDFTENASLVPRPPPPHIRTVQLSLGWHIQGEAVIWFGPHNYSFPLKSGINGPSMLFYGHGVKSNSDIFLMNENNPYIGT